MIRGGCYHEMNPEMCRKTKSGSYWLLSSRLERIGPLLCPLRANGEAAGFQCDGPPSKITVPKVSSPDDSIPSACDHGMEMGTYIGREMGASPTAKASWKPSGRLSISKAHHGQPFFLHRQYPSRSWHSDFIHQDVPRKLNTMLLTKDSNTITRVDLPVSL